MGRLLLFISILLTAYWVFAKVNANGFTLGSSGDDLVVTTDDLEARFQRAGSLSASYMVFGGTAVRFQNSFTDVTLATLDMSKARELHESYRDFHRCSSPGAAAAQEAVQTTHFVAANPAARDHLTGVLELHNMRVRGGGDRTCVSIRGDRLRLATVKARLDGTDLTDDVRSAYEDPIVYAQSVEVIDCRSALR